QPQAHQAIRGASFSIGRDTDNDLCIAHDRAVSRHHCALRIGGAGLVLRDLASRNRTYLNGRRIDGEAPVPLPSCISGGNQPLAVPAALLTSAGTRSLIQKSYSTPNGIMIPDTGFFREHTEAFLVVDVVGSTHLVAQGDVQLARIVYVLGQTLEGALQGE